MRWPVVTLGELVDGIAAGKSFGSSNPPAADGEWGIIRVSAMTWGKFQPEQNKAVPVDEVDPRFEIHEGDLLISRANTAEYVGASVLVGPVRPKLLLSDKSLRVTLRPGIDARWMWYVLQSPPVRMQITALATGTKESMRNISQASLRQISVPLPSLDEQRRIADFLEDHLSRLDTAVLLMEASSRRVVRLRQASLARAMLDAKAEAAEAPVLLGEIAAVATGMTPLKGDKKYYEGGDVPWVTSGDLHQGVIRTPKQFVTDRAVAETSLRLIPAGAILVAMYGEGKTRGTVAELAIDATINQACAAIILTNPSLKDWVLLVLAANYYGMRRLAAGGVQPNLNLSLVRSIDVPMPAAEVRSRILAGVEEVDVTARRAAAALAVGRSRAHTLRRALLAAAFSGRLTANSDPEELVSP